MEPRIDCHLAGAFRPEYSVEWRSVSFPAWVALDREPSNQHDKNAIAVFLDGQHVGYVPRNYAATLAPEIDSGWRCGAFLKKIQPNGQFVEMVILCHPDEEYCDFFLQKWFNYYAVRTVPVTEPLWVRLMRGE